MGNMTYSWKDMREEPHFPLCAMRRFERGVGCGAGEHLGWLWEEGDLRGVSEGDVRNSQVDPSGRISGLHSRSLLDPIRRSAPSLLELFRRPARWKSAIAYSWVSTEHAPDNGHSRTWPQCYTLRPALFRNAPYQIIPRARRIPSPRRARTPAIVIRRSVHIRQVAMPKRGKQGQYICRGC